jgi:Gram-negative bacterial TonB protein C-terminal
MQARSFSYHFLSPWERCTIFCVAAALTIASVAWSCAMLDRVRFRPENTVYLFLTPPHPSFLEIFRSFPHPFEGYWSGTGLTFVQPPPVTSRSYWMDVECTGGETGGRLDCHGASRDRNNGLADSALLYAEQARFRAAVFHHSDTVATVTTVQVVFDSETILERRSGPALIYPAEMRALGRGGWADIQCDIDETGRTSGCAVLYRSDAAFAGSALAYVGDGTYKTATTKEPNVIYVRHRFHVEFHPGD